MVTRRFCSTVCVVDYALITEFLYVESPQLQGPKFDQNHGSGPYGVLNAPISSLVSRHPAPRGARDYEQITKIFDLLAPPGA